jgi:hypothetical protein
MMRFVDHAARNTRLGPGAMFIFNAFIQSFAFYGSCQLPKDKSNSKNLYNSVELEGESREELSEL